MPSFDLDGLGLPFPEGAIYEGDAAPPHPESDAVRKNCGFSHRGLSVLWLGCMSLEASRWWQCIHGCVDHGLTVPR